jgi:hypothetical protein
VPAEPSDGIMADSAQPEPPNRFLYLEKCAYRMSALLLGSPEGTDWTSATSLRRSGGSSAANVTSNVDCVLAGLESDPHLQAVEQRPEFWLEQLLPPGVHALWVSAKGAVDNDLVQRALEDGELLIIELGDEQLRDPAGVDRRGLG